MQDLPVAPLGADKISGSDLRTNGDKDMPIAAQKTFCATCLVSRSIL